ncbi:MAG: phenylalanine--tRNA ligase subunit alpha [Frankiaceae bacterium]|nr:phenylalanine--tRNA ligase subunit alpha [Frankiaceae bacterium]MBV9870722.1 phenylalanine--tRNA ligase subunit alpha [Frankiaceae bacterium]
MSAPNDPYDPKEVAALSTDELAAAQRAALAAFEAATDLDQLAAAHSAHLGNKAPVALARRELGALPPQARADAGRRVNEVLTALTASYEAARTGLEAARDERVLIEEAVDVTLPWDMTPPGGRHPLTLVQERTSDVFVAMGWEVAEGPEVEAEWLNFDALNIPRSHSAREAQDTLWLDPPDGGVLLRTHTSPVQLRALLARGAPCYVVVPGRVYRQEALDATHSPVFHQLEGLAVDEGLTMADLRGTLDLFAESMFGAGVRTRLRPDHYPFTEPSADVDLLCWVCHGSSTEPGAEFCRTCRSEGWIEWGGSGMVHPVVLQSAGVDPDRYTGYAFGIGMERTLMSRHDLADIRDLVEGDVRVTTALGREA